MRPWQIICSQDETVLAEVDGKYRRGSVPLAEAYKIIDGEVRYDMPGNRGKPELVCPHPEHKGRTRPIFRRKVYAG